MPPHPNTRLRIIAFMAAVVGGTTLVIVAAHWMTDSWAVGTTTGVISAVLSAAMYPVLFRKH